MFNLLFVPLPLESNWYTFELFSGILLSYHLQVYTDHYVYIRLYSGGIKVK